MKSHLFKIITHTILLSSLAAPAFLLSGRYTKIAEENLKSIPMESQGAPNNFYYYSEFLQWSFQKLANPEAIEKRRNAFKLFEKYEKKHEYHTADVLDFTSVQDLNLICGPKSNSAAHLGAKIDKTKTELGAITLLSMITDPLVDIKTVRQRQELVRELLDNKELFSQLDTAFERVKKSENLIYSFWQEDSFEHALQRKLITIPKQPWISSELNKNDLVMELRERLSQLGDGFFLTSEVAGTVALPLAGLLSLVHKYTQKGVALKTFARDYLYVSGAVGFFSTFGIASWLLKKTLWNRYTEGINDAAVGMNYGFMVSHGIDNIKANILLLTFMQAKLSAVAHLITTLQEFAGVVNSNQALHKKFPMAQAINRVLYEVPEKEKDFGVLLALLSTQTFKQQASMLSRAGRIIAAYKLMVDQKDHLLEALHLLGELDAYMSVARLVKESAGKTCSWKFAQFKDSQSSDACMGDHCALEEVESSSKPSVEINNFWNPFLDPDRAVANSVSLGAKGNPQALVITGPNAGGKSTTMKAIVISLILAQSIGIAPVEFLEFTPFDKMMTYLNITDDIAAGNSHFKAGVLRAQELVEMAKKLKKGERGFVAVDELFNGTTYREGQAAAYSLIEFLGKNSHVACTTATHFPLITRLEEKTNGTQFRNYKVSVSYDESGHIHYPFKLEPGISRQVVALDILREEGFENEFLARAREVLTDCGI